MPIVYILTNAAMPDLIKIGRTEGSIEDRVRQLTAVPGVPLPFEVFFAAEVEDAVGWERAIHEAFDDRRINPRREFFRVSPDKPVAILRMARLRDVTPAGDIVESQDDQEALSRERRRSPNLRFSMVGVPIGAELHSVFDDSVTCRTVNDRDVEFRGDEHSLSSAALIVAREKGRTWPTIRGSQYWKHEGKTLTELRDEAGEE